MSEVSPPHVQYLSKIYSDVMYRAGLDKPELIADEVGQLPPQFTDSQYEIFDETYTYFKNKTNYFAECYDQYRQYGQQLLGKDKGRSSKADIVWVMATIAFGQEEIRGPANITELGLARKDINHLGIAQRKLGQVSPVVVYLCQQGVTERADDPLLTHTGIDNISVPIIRYRIVTVPKDGDKEPVKAKKTFYSRKPVIKPRFAL